jgi:AcrR family transcriptional regulator
MSDIASRLGMTKAALYYHFPGKHEIYLGVLDEVLSDVRGLLDDCAANPDPSEGLRAMVSGYLGFGIREKNLVNVLVTRLSPGESDIRDFVNSSRHAIIDAFASAIERTSRVDAASANNQQAATILVATMHGLILGNWFLEDGLDPESVSREIVRALSLDEPDHDSAGFQLTGASDV